MAFSGKIDFGVRMAENKQIFKKNRLFDPFFDIYMSKISQNHLYRVILGVEQAGDVILMPRKL